LLASQLVLVLTCLSAVSMWMNVVVSFWSIL
jgi:hypothetical protein